jgi:hypothetical protein
MAAVTDPSTQVLPNLGTVGAATNLQRGSTGSVDSNDPTLNLYAGRTYVALPGSAGNYLSVADSVALSITGDIDLRVWAAATDWTPGVNRALTSKYVSGGATAWVLYINAAGVLQLAGSTDGSAFVAWAASTVANAFVDGSTYAVRATRSASTGEVKFWFAAVAGAADPGSWTQLGATVTGATGAIADTATPIEIGAHSSGSAAPFAGNIYRVQIRNNIADDGSGIVLDINAASIPSAGSTSFTCTTGQTVTIASAATGAKTQVVTASMAQLAVDDYFLGGVHSSWTIPTSQSVTMWAVYRQKATPTSQFVSIVTGGALMALALISDNTTVSCILRDDAGVSASRSVTRPALGSLVVHFLVVDRAAQTITQWVNGTPSAPITCASVGEVSGTLYFPYPGWDGEVRACGLPRRVLTPAEIADITAYYQGVCV